MIQRRGIRKVDGRRGGGPCFALADMRALHAQDANWDAVVAAAKKGGGKLLIYNGTGFPIVGKIADAMTERGYRHCRRGSGRPRD